MNRIAGTEALHRQPRRWVSGTFVRRLSVVLGLSLSCLALWPADAAHELVYRPASVVSTQPGVADAAHKARILRLTDGTLLLAYADAAAAEGQNAWDLFGSIYPARDVFMTWSKDNGLTWSEPVNLSNTAQRTDPRFFHDPDGTGTHNQSYYGDSSKPNLFAPGNGNLILVTWIDRYCAADVQGVAHYDASYPATGQIDVPYGCLYAARLVNQPQGVSCVLPECAEMLTDGSRDAIQDLPRGTGAGFGIVWQEDPLGLQPGEAEGPGDGGSGAKVSHGTDIWYTYLPMKDFSQGAPWATPVAITDNAGGSTGASRPNLAMVKLPGTPAQAVLVYEETKGSGGLLEGKYAILHTFTYDKPPVASAGRILSDPLENARRLRVVAKSEPGAQHGTRMIVFWRQGKFSQGGPADIMARIGHVPAGTDMTLAANAAVGLRAEDLYPPLDPADPFANPPALNLTAPGLDHASDQNPVDDARAHRALLVGDAIAFGYTYTPDQPVSRFTAYENFNYYIRRSFDGGQTWTPAYNVSNVTDTTVNVIEPRLVGTPSTVSGSELAEDQQNDQVFYLAWGTQVNQYEAIAGPRIDLDLYMTRTTDFGETYEPVVRLAEGTDLAHQNGEIQLRTTPDGNRVFAVWMETRDDSKEAVAASAKLAPASEGAAGCSVVGAKPTPDPLLPLLALSALALIWLRAPAHRLLRIARRALQELINDVRLTLPSRRCHAVKAESFFVPKRARAEERAMTHLKPVAMLWPALLAVLTLTASGLLIAEETGVVPVPGVTINVAGTTDTASADAANCTGTDPVECPTLRDAIVFANGNVSAEGAPTIDTILVPAGTYTLTNYGLDETFTAATAENPPTLLNQPDARIGDLDLTEPVIIQGAGAATTIVEWPAEAAERDRIFHVFHPTANVDATLIGMTVRNGLLPLTPNLGAGPPSEFGDLPTTYEGLRHGGGIALGAAAVVSVNDPNKEGDVSAGLGGSQRPDETGGDTSGTYTLALDDVAIIDNVSDGDGGGLFNSGDLTANLMVIANNISAKNGGGHYNEGNTLITDSSYENNAAEGGGAIFATGNPATLMVIKRSAFVGNTAIGGAGISGRAVQIEITNTTLSGNIAADVGGGIHTNGAVQVLSSTIADNRSTGAEIAGGAGINVFPSGGALVQLHNTLLANNTAGSGEEGAAREANCGCTGSQTNCVSGTRVITTLGHNLSDDDSCNLTATGDLNNLDALLPPLAANGGPTQTHALVSIANNDPATSPAIDAGATSNCPNTDQRGQFRPADGNHDNQFVCDIGAFELFIPLADLHIDSLSIADEAFRGDALTLSVQVHNGNPDTNETAQGVQLTTTLPAALTATAATFTNGATSGDCAIAATLVTCDMGNLAIDATATASMALTVADIGAVSVSTAVSATAPADPNEGNNTATANIQLFGDSDLSLAATTDTDTVNRGENATANFTVTNLGPDDASAVVLGVELSEGTTFVSATPDNGGECTEVEAGVRCALGALTLAAPTANVSLVVTADTDEDLLLGGEVTADQRDLVAANDTAELSMAVNPVSDIELTMASSQQSVKGAKSLVLTLTVTNNGPSDATGVTLTGTVPADADVRSITPETGSCTQAADVITCTLGDLAAGASTQVEVVAVPLAVGEYTVTAEAGAEPLDPDLTNNGGTLVFERKSKGGGLCAYRADAEFDPVLPALVLISFMGLLWRRRARRATV